MRGSDEPVVLQSMSSRRHGLIHGGSSELQVYAAHRAEIKQQEHNIIVEADLIFEAICPRPWHLEESVQETCRCGVTEGCPSRLPWSRDEYKRA